MRSIKSLIYISVSIIIFCCLFICCNGPNDTENSIKIEKYRTLLEEDPINCHYNEQLAANYQAINDIDHAIEYYNIVVDNCPNYIVSIFDLGVCYYIKMEKDIGLKYMDLAIERASQSNRSDLVKDLEDSKAGWLRKWESIKELKWNKGKQ